MNDQYYNEQLDQIVPTQMFIVYLNKRYEEQGQVTISDAVAALELYKQSTKPNEKPIQTPHTTERS